MSKGAHVGFFSRKKKEQELFLSIPFTHKGIDFVSKVAMSSPHLEEIKALGDDFIEMNKQTIDEIMTITEETTREELLNMVKVCNKGGRLLVLELADSMSQPAFAPFSSKANHDHFNHYVEEAKFVSRFFGLDFSELHENQKVFSFIHKNPDCMAFMVTFGDGIHLIQCVEGAPIELSIPFSEILEAEIIEHYSGDGLDSDDPDSDNSLVHHLRTPRKAMSLKTKEIDSILIAHSDQMQFVAGYLMARRGNT
jgi:hypothetical protein